MTKNTKKSAALQGFRDRLREAVERDGRAVSAISEAAGLGRSHLDGILRGPSGPTAETAIRLARALDVPAGWLLAGEGPRDAGAVTLAPPRYPQLEQLLTLLGSRWPPEVVERARGVRLLADVEPTAAQWHAFLDAEAEALAGLESEPLGDVDTPPLGRKKSGR